MVEIIASDLQLKFRPREVVLGKVQSEGKCVRNLQSLKMTIVGRFHCVAARLLSNAS